MVRAYDDQAGGYRDVGIRRQDTAGNVFDFDELEYGAEEKAVLEVEEIGHIPRGLDTYAAVTYLASVARRPRQTAGGRETVRRLVADNYEFGALSTLLKKAGLRPNEEQWTAPSKQRAVDRCERMLRDGTLRLPQHEMLRRQMAEFSEQVTRAGNLRYSGSGRHDDFAQCVITLMMADIAGHCPGSPHTYRNVRHELG